MRSRSGIAAIVLLLCTAPACDLGVGNEAEIPFRDEGATGEDVAAAESPTIPATPSPTETPTPTPSPTASESPAPTPSSEDEPDANDDDAAPREGRKPRFAFPRAGSYVYSQQGYEEFCTSTCASDPLPSRYGTRIAHGRSSRRAIAVIETARISRNRTLSTITRHTRTRAHRSDVVSTFIYRGRAYTGRYRPTPAIEALRLPLTTGTIWSGRWRGETSGSYRFNVMGFDDIRTGGRSIRAARIVARMAFSGRYEGYSVVTLWVDPSSRVTVASVGSMEISSDFGRYTTDFDTQLVRGPGY